MMMMKKMVPMMKVIDINDDDTHGDSTNNDDGVNLSDNTTEPKTSIPK